jgi:hypothetical protein
MAIGANWAEIWAPVWKEVWTQTAPTPEPEPEATQKPAGRLKPRRKLLVEIDGRDFEVSSPEEAISLLERAKTLAQEAIEKTFSVPTRVKPGIDRPRIRTREPELRPIVQKARDEITQIYDSAIRDFEIRALMAKAEEEEEEALIRLLM